MRAWVIVCFLLCMCKTIAAVSVQVSAPPVVREPGGWYEVNDTITVTYDKSGMTSSSNDFVAILPCNCGLNSGFISFACGTGAGPSNGYYAKFVSSTSGTVNFTLDKPQPLGCWKAALYSSSPIVLRSAFVELDVKEFNYTYVAPFKCSATTCAAEAVVAECQPEKIPYWLLFFSFLFQFLWTYILILRENKKKKTKVSSASSGVALEPVPGAEAMQSEDATPGCCSRMFSCISSTISTSLALIIGLVSMALGIVTLVNDFSIVLDYSDKWGSGPQAYNCYAMVTVNSPNIKAGFVLGLTHLLRGRAMNAASSTKIEAMFEYFTFLLATTYIPVLVTHTIPSLVVYFWVYAIGLAATGICSALISTLCSCLSEENAYVVKSLTITAGVFVVFTVLPQIMVRYWISGTWPPWGTSGDAYIDAVSDTLSERSTSAYLDAVSEDAKTQLSALHLFF